MGGVQSPLYTTIEEGRSCTVSDRRGHVHVVTGPHKVARLGNKIVPLSPVVANEVEYLIVKFTDGHSEVRPGPCSLLQHPVEHASITRHAATRITEQEVLVVYRRDPTRDGVGTSTTQGSVSSALQHAIDIVHGPAMYVPQTVSEWTHEFSWTGLKGFGSTTMFPNALVFTKLSIAPQKIYYDAEKVRTKDQAVVTVKLTVHYEYEDIAKMVRSSNDPPADLVNAVAADVVEWCITKEFSEFTASVDVLGTLEPYKHLLAVAERLGLRITKVVLRTHESSAALQKIHDVAIERRSDLALKREAAEEEQRLVDMQFERESARVAKKAALDVAQLEGDIALKLRGIELEEDVKRAIGEPLQNGTGTVQQPPPEAPLLGAGNMVTAAAEEEERTAQVESSCGLWGCVAKSPPPPP